VTRRTGGVTLLAVTAKQPKPKNPATARELLARNLVALRTERGLSQEDLSADAGFHRTYVTHLEGRRRNVGIDAVERLAGALKVPVARLLQD
jgi:DNA-binding Xre family transcriptional regulator